MFGAPPIDVVVGAEVHVSIQKALSLAGFGMKRVVTVEADGQGRMRGQAAETQRTHHPLHSGRQCEHGRLRSGRGNLCASKGPRRMGSRGRRVRSLGECFSKYRHLTAGFDQADSWATDAHKWPNVNYDSGIVIVRDGAALSAAMTMTAAYLEPSGRREPRQYTPDASRRARGVELWAALKSLGRSGLCTLIERTCAHAQKFAQELRNEGFAVMNDVVINQVLVSFGNAEITREVIRRIQDDGTCWCGATVWQGKTAMRISVSSWATTEADVDRSLAAMVRIARECNPR